MFHSLIRCLAPAVLAAGLTAQTVPPAAAAPLPAPHVRVTALGPQGWRLRLGPTNLGVLLDGEPARALWRPLLAGFGDDVASLLGDQA
jgi:hypothetical protein